MSEAVTEHLETSDTDIVQGTGYCVVPVDAWDSAPRYCATLHAAKADPDELCTIEPTRCAACAV